MTGRTPAHTIRRDSSRGPRKLLYIAVFALTGLAVYWWGLAGAQPSKSSGSHTSTATVHLPAQIHPAADPQQILRQITAKENLYRAVRRLASAANLPNNDSQAAADRAVEIVSRNLRVTANPSSLNPSSLNPRALPGGIAVSITYTDQSAQYPSRLVNTLAQSYADDCRQQWKRQTYWAQAKAREASEYAKQEFLRAKARLEEFSQRHFETRQTQPPAETIDLDDEQFDGPRSTSAEVPESDARTAATADLPSAVNLPLVDNPRWVELNDRLAALVRRRAELLIDRTPLHPEVQDIELRIAALKQQLSAIPSRIPGDPSDPAPAADRVPDAQMPVHPDDPPPATNPPVSEPVEPAPGQAASQPTEAAREFRTLKEAADLATETYLQAVQLERQAWQEYLREPQLELDLAQPGPVAAPPARLQLTLLWVALTAALAVTSGLGMISAGAAIQPPLTTVEQVRRALPVPIVGIIPETSPTSRPRAGKRTFIRWTLILGGLILVAGCVCILFRSWGGF